MKKIILLSTVFCVFITFHCKAQGLSLDWAKQIGGKGQANAYCISITLDNNRNIYTIGDFADTVDFDPGSAVFNLISKGQNDIFIQKLDSNGNFQWVKQMGGHGNDWSYSINSDTKGNIYTTGIFLDTVNFDPGSGVLNLISKGGADIFIQKLDSNGFLLWAKQIGGSGFEWVQSLKVNTSGEVYITGAFQDTVNFDPNAGIHNLISKGNDDCFILKLDANGNFLWVKQIGGIGADRGNSITADAKEDIYITGYFQDTVNFDLGKGMHNLVSNSYSDIFIQKLDSDGNFIWVKQMGNTSSGSQSTSITTDSQGNIYSTGEFWNTIDLDPGTGIFTLTSGGGPDIYIQKLNSNGNFIWAKQMGGIDSEYSVFITTDMHANVYTTGFFNNTADFDPGSTIFNCTSNGASDIFIQKLDSNGIFQWAKQIGGKGYDDGTSIICDSNGDVFTNGIFQNTVYFDTSVSYTSNGLYDGFIQKLNQCSSKFIPATLSINACHSYSLHNQTFTKTGTYSQIVGCDSIITINITILSTDASVEINGMNLIANNPEALYQWIDCNKGNMPIIGDTYQSFTPKANGKYAVIVTKNGCSDTSSCYNLTSVGIINKSVEDKIVIYPNPFSLTSTLKTNENLKDATLTVYNSFGQQVKQIKNINGQTMTLHRGNLPSGLYFLRLSQNNKTYTLDKFVISDN